MCAMLWHVGWLRRMAIALGCVFSLLVCLWGGFLYVTRITPPPGRVDARHLGGSGSLRRQGNIWELTLAGTPAELGARHGMLAADLMQKVDRELERTFAARVPRAMPR